MSGDASLLISWRGGDQKAGEELFSLHFDSLYRFFRTKAPLDVDDLVQRTFLACVQKADSLRDASAFRAFLFGVARIELLHFFRERGRRGIDVFTADFSVADMADSPSILVGREHNARRFGEALQSLPVDLQIAVELHYWEGMSGPDIATVLEVPLGTVKSRIRRAKQLLRAELEQSLSGGSPRTVEQALAEFAQALGHARLADT